MGLLIHEAIIGHGEVYKDVKEAVKEKDIDHDYHGIPGHKRIYGTVYRE